MTFADLTPDTAQLLVAASKEARNPGVLKALVKLFMRTDPAELADGISQVELARRADITDRSVRRALRQLEALGVIITVRLPKHRLGYVIDRERLAIVERNLP